MPKNKDKNETKEIFTLAQKNLYLQADPAFNAMYERKIGVKDLQVWLRSNPKEIP